MTNQDLEKVSHALAVYAVKGDRSGLEKQADISQFLSDAYAKAQPYLNDPYVRNSLLGAGAGGLVGLMQPKRKLNNALTYGLLGGMGGLGLTQAFNSAQAVGGGAAQQEQPKRLTEDPNFTATFKDAPVVPRSAGQAARQIGTVLNHPISAFNKVRELLDDPHTYKGIDSEYVTPALKALDKNIGNPMRQAGDFGGLVREELIKNVRGYGDAIANTVGEVGKFRDAMRDAHTQRMQSTGDALGSAYGNAVTGVRDTARNIGRFGRSVMDEHNKNMQNLGENYLYPAVKPLYNAGSAISNWWNRR